MEWYLEQGKLISEEDWTKSIDCMKDSVSSDNYNKEELKEALISSIKNRISKKTAIFFSGGIDSTFIAFICKKLGADITCYTVGFQDTNFKIPEDIIWAKKVAKDLGLPLNSKILTLAEVEKIFEKTIKILGENANAVTVGVGAVFVSAAELGPEKSWLGGLGSEEIFAGYDRHKQNPSNNECWNGLKLMYQRDMIRDTLIASSYGITIGTPFLDEELIKIAMTFPITQKLKNDLTKWILREIALDMGLPEEFAMRKKRAAQYGSSFDRALAKIARLRGFKFKKEYIESLK